MKNYTLPEVQVFAEAFVAEYMKAREKFPFMRSAHEGYAIVLEEMDELWEIVKQKQSERNYGAMRKEAIQAGAMILAFYIEIVDTNNRK